MNMGGMSGMNQSNTMSNMSNLGLGGMGGMNQMPVQQGMLNTNQFSEGMLRGQMGLGTVMMNQNRPEVSKDKDISQTNSQGGREMPPVNTENY